MRVVVVVMVMNEQTCDQLRFSYGVQIQREEFSTNNDKYATVGGYKCTEIHTRLCVCIFGFINKAKKLGDMNDISIFFIQQTRESPTSSPWHVVVVRQKNA